MFAIDFDGTIADTNTLKSLWILEHLGIRIPPYACDKTTCVSKIGIDHYMKMANEVYKADCSLKAEPIPGSFTAINALKAYGPIYVITARDKEELLVASEWLSIHKLSKNIAQLLLANGTSKINLAESLNCKVLIDDDIRHLVSDSSQLVSRILLKVGLDEDMKTPPNVTLCTTWRVAKEKALEFYRNH
jgi:uncharacterized HAD superfamily protein